VFDAITSTRVYRAASPIGEACEIMSKGRGTQFDPDLLDAFLADVRECAPTAPHIAHLRAA
jgi:HD-GYP domain-containing protein (c-di-GMP phosphodiesterase class II)